MMMKQSVDNAAKVKELPKIHQSATNLKAMIEQRRVVQQQRTHTDRNKLEEHKRAKLRERRLKEFNEQEAATMHLFSRITNTGWRTEQPAVNLNDQPNKANSLIEVKDRLDSKIFKGFKKQANSITALEEILHKANRLEGQASHSLGEDGLKNILDLSKETANEVLILEDPVLLSVQIEKINLR